MFYFFFYSNNNNNLSPLSHEKYYSIIPKNINKRSIHKDMLAIFEKILTNHNRY